MTVVAASVLIAATIGYRLPYISHDGPLDPDEVLTVNTIHQIRETGMVPAFKLGQDYMFPAEELVGALLSAFVASDSVAARAPAAIYTALGAALLFMFFLRAGAGGVLAFTATLPLVFCSSAIARYTASGTGEYGFAVLFAAGYPLLCLHYDCRRSKGLLFLLGVVGGIGIYVFSVTAMTTLACIVWLIARSDAANRIAAQPRFHRTVVVVSVLIGAALLVGAAPVCRLLVYGVLSFKPYGILLATATVLGVVAMSIAQRRMQLLHGDSFRSLLVFGIPLAVFSLSPVVYYKAVVAPRLVAEGREPIHQPGYVWKHPHEWGQQCRLLVTRVLPILLEGQLCQTGAGVTVPGAFGSPESLRSLAALVWLMACFGSSIRSIREVDRRDGALGMLFGPALLVTVVTLPSWHLFGDFSYRYWCPFYLAVCASFVSLPGFSPGRGPWLSRLAVVFAIGLAIYNTTDYLAFVSDCM